MDFEGDFFDKRVARLYTVQRYIYAYHYIFRKVNNVMKRFYKVDKSRVHNSSFGIGLSIANRIVKNYNGEIFISSELDKYTKISIYFEMAEY